MNKIGSVSWEGEDVDVSKLQPVPGYEDPKVVADRARKEAEQGSSRLRVVSKDQSSK